MGDYFTPEHFKLLNKWKDQKRDKSNPEQNNAYESLERAYEVTEAWAHQLKQKLFPQGRVQLRKRPTNQANNFAAYNWARIYPSQDSPQELAYTVGIAADVGFVVKIDTVGMSDFDPTRKAYMDLRGAYTNSSPIVAMLPATEGLAKSLPALVDWSVESIRGFGLRYDEVAAKLGISTKLDDAAVLARFDSKPEFKAARVRWSPDVTASFCRFARSVHEAGLDWWCTDIAGPQIRFGRKQQRSLRASAVLGYLHCGKSPMVQINPGVNGVDGRGWTPMTDNVIQELVVSLDMARDAIEEWKPEGVERAGLWPDQLQNDPSEPAEPDAQPRVQEKKEPRGQEPCFNRIYYGPPGTGKTRKLGRLLKANYEEPIASVSQEEWRAQFIAEHIAGLTWWEGVAAALFDLGERAKVARLFDHPFVRAIAAAKGRNQNVHQTLWGTLQHHAVEESETVKTKQRLAPAVFDKSPDSVWHLAGEWEEACADLRDLVTKYRAGAQSEGRVRRYTFVTFHQSYGYEEFVEGLRPVLGGGESGDIQYEIRAGAFKELCSRARSAPDQRFAIVIDEINRGNISKIFGELITLIEVEKREGMDDAVPVTLSYSGESFSVPKNVDIIGSMNTADRSLALVDTALRRRFEFVPCYPDTSSEPEVGEEDSAPLAELMVEHDGISIDVRLMLERINQRIEALYDRDHTIGHAYFTSLRKISVEKRFVALGEIFKKRIVPLLEEYFFEDWQKIRLVLGDNQKKVDGARFIVAHEEGALANLFGNESGLEDYSGKPRFERQLSAFSNPMSYIGIYS